MPESTPGRRRAGHVARVALTVAALGVMWACRPQQGPQPGDQRAPGGGSPPSGVPSAKNGLPKTGLLARHRAEWRPILGWPDDCEQAFQASRVGDDAGLVFEEDSAGLWVVHVLCATGSYQPSSVFVRLDERGSAPTAAVLTLSTLQSEDGTSIGKIDTTEIWGEPSVSGEERRLTVLNLSRQTGDCGIWTRYDIRDGVLDLAEAWARLPCPAEPEAPAAAEAGRPPKGWTRVPIR
jgi:hypothetical protein